MKKQLYEKSGYLNTDYLLSLPSTFNFIIGGRGIGKTYGFLKAMVERKTPFIFMRRTQTQAELLSSPKLMPFNTLNSDMGWNIEIQKSNRWQSDFMDGETLIGSVVALSTIGNIKGFDGSHYQALIFDEFIKDPHERTMKNEAVMFLNAYETLNRNREKKGMPPVKCYFLANSTDLSNPLFIYLNMVRKANEMQNKKKDIYINEKQGYSIILPHDSPISEMKKKSALGRLTAGTEFEKTTFDNLFIDDGVGEIKSENLLEYRPLVQVGEITIYRHKSQRRYYVSTHCTGSPVQFSSGDIGLAQFRKSFYWLWGAYLDGLVIFEEKLCEILLTNYFS